jgi:hypothetical protein
MWDSQRCSRVAASGSSRAMAPLASTGRCSRRAVGVVDLEEAQRGERAEPGGERGCEGGARGGELLGADDVEGGAEEARVGGGEVPGGVGLLLVGEEGGVEGEEWAAEV